VKSSQPNASDPATAAVERLLLVTLALEDTLQCEQYAETDALLARRSEILDELSKLALTPKSKISIERVQAAERRIIGYLSDWRSAALVELEGARTGARANTAYLGKRDGAGFSMDARH